MLFKPGGTFDIATDPSSLPAVSDNYNVQSGAMQRCKNFRRDQQGKLTVRDGITKINTGAPINTPVWNIIVQAGTRYTFASTRIYKNEVSIKSGLTSARWSAISYNSYNSTTQNVFALNGTDRKRIEGSNVYEWGIDPPTVAPVLAIGAGSGLTGTYNAVYTYARLEGSVVISESTPSDPAIAGVALSNQSLSITWTASSDSQVTHVGVYRTLTDGLIYYLDQYVAIGTLTLDSTKADGNLLTEVNSNHQRPPLGSYIAGPNYNGTTFIIKDNLLYYSLAKQPEYFPTSNYIEISPPEFPGQCLVFHNGKPYYLTKNKIYYIQGTGANTFFPYKMESITGAQGPFGAVSVDGKGIFHTGSDGIYLYNGDDMNITKRNLQPIFRGVTTNGIPGVGSMANAWLIHFKDLLFFGYPSASATYPDNIIVFDLTTNAMGYYSFATGEISSVAIDETNNKLVAGDSNGFLWYLEDAGATDDDGTMIDWEVQSMDYTLATRYHFPRWVKYDVDLEDGSSATGEIILDGSTLQSHTITGSRNTKYRLITTGNGRRCSLKISGNGPAVIYPMEME